jgi:hypothetical protein
MNFIKYISAVIIYKGQAENRFDMEKNDTKWTVWSDTLPNEYWKNYVLSGKKLDEHWYSVKDD